MCCPRLTIPNGTSLREFLTPEADGRDPCLPAHVVVHFPNVRLNSRHNLNTRRTGTYNRDVLALIVKLRIPSCRMNLFPGEAVDSWDIRPFPCIENADCAYEVVALINKRLLSYQ